MSKITIYKTEWGKTKERTIEWEIEYFDWYVKIRNENSIQLIKNFENMIINE